MPTSATPTTPVIPRKGHKTCYFVTVTFCSMLPPSLSTNKQQYNTIRDCVLVQGDSRWSVTVRAQTAFPSQRMWGLWWIKKHCDRFSFLYFCCLLYYFIHLSLMLYNFGNYNILMGTAVAQWLRCSATNRKAAGSIPASVSGFFSDIKSFRSHYGPGVDSASNRNEYQEHFLGVKAAVA